MRKSVKLPYHEHDNPPPDSSSLLSTGTSIHYRSTTTDRVDPQLENRDMTVPCLAREMGPFFVGPIPPLKFLKSFMPSAGCSTFKPGMFRPLVEKMASTTEPTWYRPFVSSDPCRLLHLFLGLILTF